MQFLLLLLLVALFSSLPAVLSKNVENYDNWDHNVPVASEAMTQKAVPLPVMKGFTDSVLHLSGSVKAHPNNGQYWLDRAQRLMHYGLYREAVHDFREAQKHLSNSDNRATIGLARCYFNLQDYPQALWVAQRLLARDKSSAEGHALRALGLFNDPDRAIEECDKAIALKPSVPWFYVSRARINQGNNRLWTQTLKDCRTALRLAPKNLSARLFRANAYLKLGKVDKAMEDCNSILAAEPLYLEAYKIRCKVHRQMGDENLAKMDEYLYQTCIKRMQEVVEENQ